MSDRGSVRLGWLLALVLAATAARGQSGSVYFNNRVVAVDLSAPVYLHTTNGAPLAGTNFLAQLFVAAPGTEVEGFVSAGIAVPFYADARAGFLDLSGDPDLGTRSVPVAPGSNVLVQMRAWSADGVLFGQSKVIELTTRGMLFPPVEMVGLESFAIEVIPEPGARLLLAASGLAALAWRRRRYELV